LSMWSVLGNCSTFYQRLAIVWSSSEINEHEITFYRFSVKETRC